MRLTACLIAIPARLARGRDMYAMTAAHPTLPIPSYVKVTNLENRRSAVVRINGRGPFHAGRPFKTRAEANQTAEKLRESLGFRPVVVVR